MDIDTAPKTSPETSPTLSLRGRGGETILTGSLATLATDGVHAIGFHGTNVEFTTTGAPPFTPNQRPRKLIVNQPYFVEIVGDGEVRRVNRVR